MATQKILNAPPDGKMMQRVKTFTRHHPYIGPAIWIYGIQYFIVQLVVAAAWNSPFSLLTNPISDLGNTACGMYDDRYVCSPLHDWMNASFILFGLTVTIGSVLLYYGFRKNIRSYIGFSLMALAGIGTMLVGIFPENGIGALHTLGALLPFLLGNLSLIVLGLSLEMPRWFKYYTVISGVVGLVALIFLVFQNYLGSGPGGLERVVAYPQTIWMITFGVYVSSHRYRERRGKN